VVDGTNVKLLCGYLLKALQIRQVSQVMDQSTLDLMYRITKSMEQSL